MAMTRVQFENSFHNVENRIVRRAFLMQALAQGPDWKQWRQAGRSGTTPAIYNDLLFCACYGIYKRGPTRNMSIQMRDFLWARNASDSGFLMNPFYQGSDIRKATGQTAVMLSSEHKKLEDAAQPAMVIGDPSTFQKVNIPDAAGNNIYLHVYSELFMPNGSMNAFLKSADQASAIANLGTNVGTVKSSTTMLEWIDALVKKFSGSTTLSSRYGQTFDCDTLGLTGNDDQTTKWKRGRTPVVMGGHR